MAAPGLSKAEYLRRYLAGAAAQAEGGRRKRRRKAPGSSGRGMRIVDDDVSWNSISAAQEKEEEEEDEGDLPVVAEFIDERPEEVKRMEEFRTNSKWKLLGDQNEDSQSSDLSLAAKRTARKNRDSSDLDTSPSRRKRTGSPSGLKKQSSTRGFSPANKKPKQALSPGRRKRHDSDSSLPQKCSQDLSDSDLSPPRNSHRPGLLHRDSPSKLSPPKRNQNTSSDSDLSSRRSQAAGKKLHGSRSSPGLLPHRRGPDSKRSFQGERGENQRASQMLSGGKAGLVSADLLRREQQELRRLDRNKYLEDESQNAETVFRDKSGRKRDLMQERLEQHKKAEAKSERDELYAKWGKGLAQSRQQQQNVEDAVKEMQKPLARYIDDQDLDQMLREKEREGDPMANFIRKKKAKESKDKKEKPRYNGPAPPLNRFNLWPGYRWDGVDRSNGFEQKRFARLASKKAVQELAYKWSVEDM
uniref:BUD13 homolog n=1 Tax=Gopherus agassizii TaxID=38772 RepID=A0A452HG30_9SAUR